MAAARLENRADGLLAFFGKAASLLMNLHGWIAFVCHRHLCGSRVMKWVLTNFFGAATWIVGILIAKGSQLASGGVVYTSDHPLLLGAICGIAGLAILLWANIKSTA